MSFETIKIYRDLPVKSGFVQIPPNDPISNSRLTPEAVITLLNNSRIVRLSIGSGKSTGSKCGQQEFVRLAGLHPNSWYDADPVAQLS